MARIACLETNMTSDPDTPGERLSVSYISLPKMFTQHALCLFGFFNEANYPNEAKLN